MSTRGWIKPRLIIIDESEYNTDKEFVNKIGGIFGVYIYDSNMHTYLCESTPSYALEGFCAVMGKARDEFSEEEWETLQDTLDEVWGESNREQPITYRRASEVDALPTFKLDTERCNAKEYDNFMEELVQAYHQNYPYFDELEWEVDMRGYLSPTPITVSGFTKSHVVRKLGLDNFDLDRITLKERGKKQ